MTAVGVGDLEWLDGEMMVYFEPDEETVILSLIAGNSQHERVTEQLAERLTVTLWDQYENPIPNRLTTFQLVSTPENARDMQMSAAPIVANKSTVSNNAFSEYRVEVISDTLGKASVLFKLGNRAGDYLIEASTPGMEPVLFVATALPNKYVLHQNYPNPFNSNTKILYDVPVESNVTITIFDVLGRQVATLVNEVKPIGLHTIDLDMNRLGLTSGVYIYRMSALGLENGSQYVKTQKMLYVK